jgi:hypothetical protein
MLQDARVNAGDAEDDKGPRTTRRGRIPLLRGKSICPLLAMRGNRGYETVLTGNRIDGWDDRAATGRRPGVAR